IDEARSAIFARNGRLKRATVTASMKHARDGNQSSLSMDRSRRRAYDDCAEGGGGGERFGPGGLDAPPHGRHRERVRRTGGDEPLCGVPASDAAPVGPPRRARRSLRRPHRARGAPRRARSPGTSGRSEEHTSELQSRENLVCRLLLEKKKKKRNTMC